eukprot:7461785-Karenia_brevis.AAC.1
MLMLWRRLQSPVDVAFLSSILFSEGTYSISRRASMGENEDCMQDQAGFCGWPQHNSQTTGGNWQEQAYIWETKPLFMRSSQ